MEFAQRPASAIVIFFFFFKRRSMSCTPTKQRAGRRKVPIERCCRLDAVAEHRGKVVIWIDLRSPLAVHDSRSSAVSQQGYPRNTYLGLSQSQFKSFKINPPSRGGLLFEDLSWTYRNTAGHQNAIDPKFAGGKHGPVLRGHANMPLPPTQRRTLRLHNLRPVRQTSGHPMLPARRPTRCSRRAVLEHLAADNSAA